MNEENKENKKRKWCGFREGRFCSESCGLYVPGIHQCVLHGINKNLGQLIEAVKIGD